MSERKFVVQTEDNVYENLSFEESYTLFIKLNSEGTRASCYPVAEEYKAP